MTRLENFFAQYQTTGDSTSIDYDYSIEDEESKDPTHFTLPLAPISDENDTSIYTIHEPQSSTVQYQIELNDYSFRKSNDTQNSTDSSSVAPSTLPIDILEENATVEDQGNSSEVNENSSTLHENATHLNENNINLDQRDTTTVESLEQIDSTLETESPETTTSRDTLSFGDQFDEDDNYSTTSGELVINKSESFDDESQAEKTINDTSDTTTAAAFQLDDYFDAILLNDSLLIDESSSSENATETDYDSTTITQWPYEVEQTDGSVNETDVDETITSTTSTTAPFLSTTTIENSLTPNNDFPYENPIIKDDQQNADLENVEASNKFVYHHLSATQSQSDENMKSSVATPSTVVRFPAQVGERQRVRFPDELLSPSNSPPPVTMSFSWPRDNVGYQTVGVMRFWQQQPLINDFKFISRGNSRGPGVGFNRPQATYRRNY